jgi:hypothetical protein
MTTPAQPENTEQQEQAKAADLPQQRQQGDTGSEVGTESVQMQGNGYGSDPLPRIKVLGRMEGQIAVQLGWRKGMVAISNSRFRFLRDDLGMNIRDNPDEYLF